MRYSDFAAFPRKVRPIKSLRARCIKTHQSSFRSSLPSALPSTGDANRAKRTWRKSFSLDSARVCRPERLNLFLKPPKRTRGNTNQRFCRAMNSIATFRFLSSVGAKLFHFSSNVKRSDFESNAWHIRCIIYKKKRRKYEERKWIFLSIK